MEQKPWGFRQKLEAHLTFEQSLGKQAKGMVYEVGVDGSFLVRPRRTPKEWSWDDLNDPRLGRMEPTFFLIDFNPRRVTHRRIHGLVEYKFDPNSLGQTLLERVANLTNRLTNPSAKARAWYVERLREMGVQLPPEFHTFSVSETDENGLYFTASDSVYHTTAGMFGRLNADGTITEILRAPGRFLTAVFHPFDRQRLLISAEGYDKTDPHWQCLYELDLRTGDYRVIEFLKPAGNDLFGSRVKFFPDHRIALVNRYGFVPEGGGLWLMGINNPDYDPKRRLLAWDHSQVWMFFKTPDPQVLRVFFTAKEVDNQMTMTVNQAWLHLEGIKTRLVEPERIAKVRGWNPIPFHTERIGKYRNLVYVASNSHEDYLASRPSGIYLFEVSA